MSPSTKEFLQLAMVCLREAYTKAVTEKAEAIPEITDAIEDVEGALIWFRDRK